MGDKRGEPLAVEELAGYVPEIGRWLWVFEATRQRLKQALEGMEVDVLDWTSPESDNASDNTIGSLLYHISAIEMDWLYADIVETDFPAEVETLFPSDVRDAQGKLTGIQGFSLTEHLQRLDRSRLFLLDTFRQMNIAEFRRSRHLANYEVTPEWVLHHLIQHEAEHRGQIMELRARAERALGIK